MISFYRCNITSALSYHLCYLIFLLLCSFIDNIAQKMHRTISLGCLSKWSLNGNLARLFFYFSVLFVCWLVSLLVSVCLCFVL